MRLPRALVFAATCALLATCSVACGVKYSDPPPGTEFFKKLTIAGDLHVGGTITADVAIEQHNPLDVAVNCSLRRSSTVLQLLSSTVVAAKPDGGPTATPVASTHHFEFKVEGPGTYNVKCVTPSDIDNFIAKEFSVAPAVTPTPTESPPGTETPTVPSG